MQDDFEGMGKNGDDNPVSLSPQSSALVYSCHHPARTASFNPVFQPIVRM